MPVPVAILYRSVMSWYGLQVTMASHLFKKHSFGLGAERQLMWTTVNTYRGTHGASRLKTLAPSIVRSVLQQQIKF